MTNPLEMTPGQVLQWEEQSSGNWIAKNALIHLKIWKDETGYFYPMADMGNLVWKPTYKHTTLDIAKSDATAFHATLQAAIDHDLVLKRYKDALESSLLDLEVIKIDGLAKLCGENIGAVECVKFVKNKLLAALAEAGEKKEKCTNPRCVNGQVTINYHKDLWQNCPTCNSTGAKP